MLTLGCSPVRQYSNCSSSNSERRLTVPQMGDPNSLPKQLNEDVPIVKLMTGHLWINETSERTLTVPQMGDPNSLPKQLNE